jgi:hypothetical protein
LLQLARVEVDSDLRPGQRAAAVLGSGNVL